MRFVSFMLLLCHFIVLTQPAIAIQQELRKDMTVTVAKQNTLIGNKGYKHDITVGMIYEIIRDEIIIGKAEVKVVKETMCGLIIQALDSGYRAKVGDRLRPQKKIISEQQDILAAISELEFTPDKLIKEDTQRYDSPSDYYFSGKEAADNDYGSAFGGGLVAGLLGGLIGWGIGYGIVSSQGAEVPPRYLTDLNADEKLQFRSGYKEKIKSKRKSTFNAGALTGTLLIVAIVVAASNSQY